MLRKQRGFSQEELSEGIMSTISLSRLETGEQLPHKFNIDEILKKLGFNTLEDYKYFLNEREREINEKCDKLLNLIDNDRNNEAEIILNELFTYPEFKKDKYKYQLLLLCRASIMVNLKQDSEEIRKIVSEAIKISFKSFAEKDISNYFLSEQEINLIIILSITYLNEKNVDKAIEILESLKKSLDDSTADDRYKSKSYPLVLLNLIECYELTEQYLKAVETCDFGKEICLKTNKMRQLPDFVYNKAYCMYELGYREECLPLLYQAYYGYDMMRDTAGMEKVRKHAKEKHDLSFEEE